MKTKDKFFEDSESEQSEYNSAGSSSSEEEEEAEGFKAKPKNKDFIRAREPIEEEVERPSFGGGLGSSQGLGLGSRKLGTSQGLGSRPTQTLDKGFAGFEKHSKGIGSKLLMKMGYKLGEAHSIR